MLSDLCPGSSVTASSLFAECDNKPQAVCTVCQPSKVLPQRQHSESARPLRSRNACAPLSQGIVLATLLCYLSLMEGKGNSSVLD